MDRTSEYIGITDWYGKPFIWVNRPLEDGSLTTGGYDPELDRLSVEDKRKMNLDLRRFRDGRISTKYRFMHLQKRRPQCKDLQELKKE